MIGAERQPVKDWPARRRPRRAMVYFKIGLYCDSLTVPMTMLIARFRRGTSRAEVDPAPSP